MKSPAAKVLETPTQVLPIELETRAHGAVTPQFGCPTCGSSGGTADLSRPHAPPSYVYAIGRVEARFPNVAVEKEFAQAGARTDTAGKTDHQTFHAVLSKRENRYLVRQLCWVLNIQDWTPI